MQIDLYTQEGTKKGHVDVSDEFFGVKRNDTLIHRLLQLQLSNGRQSVAHTLTKGGVRGGGKKPYAQKHTGRARQGSTRNPHFRGGGVVFGPDNNRRFILSMPQKERRKALFSCLSMKAKEKLVLALDKFETDTPKTKHFATMLKKFPFDRNVLFVLAAKDETLHRVSHNLKNVKTILVNYLNVGDLMRYKHILFLQDALPKMEEIFLK